MRIWGMYGGGGLPREGFGMWAGENVGYMRISCICVWCVGVPKGLPR